MKSLTLEEAMRQAEALVGKAEMPSGKTELPSGKTEIVPNIHTLAKLLMDAAAEGRPLRVKFGVDPTSPDLHLGHTVGLRALKRFQDFGHDVILVIGGFTAQQGDPSGRNAARPQLSAQQVAHHARTYLEQVALVLDMDRVRLMNNADWLSSVDIIKLASLVTVNQLLAKDGFGSRIEQNQPLGLHELVYPLLQGFDSVHLQADIELGGSDQRFNILMGRQLQPHFGQRPQLALLLPLLVGTDGVRKMSKSFGNSIGLTDAPELMFAKVMGIADTLIEPFAELASNADSAFRAEIKQHLQEGGNPKEAKERLALILVGEFHGIEAAQAAKDEWNKVHSKREMPSQMPSHLLDKPSEAARVLKDCGLCASINEARRLIDGGGVRLDSVKITDRGHVLAVPPPAGQVLQVGRRSFVRLLPPAQPENSTA